MRNGKAKSRLTLAAVMLAGVAAATAPVVAASGADIPAGMSAPAASSQVTLESKTRLVKLLLAQSPAVQRIPQSDNAQAKKKLADAQALYAKAASEAGAGHADAAIKLLDQALLDIVSASRMVPDPAQLASQERARYAGLAEATRTFLALHKSLSARTSKKGGALDLPKINAMVEKAEGLAAGGNHQEANALLNNVYKMVVGALSNMLMAETIVYDQKFEAPADEFNYELARNRSYEELIPLALTQLNPPRETAVLSEKYVQQSRALRDAAQKQAAGGDYAAALKTIQDATGQLQRSLRVAGVIVPQSPER
jgi:hypothetical protein